ncbi:phosphate ABC transporter permease [Marinihelvus fidelis]|uniref:Transport permease protein n=1 Tax=Marinihelvus fidelis TaxID=2613842 RepID=A0A5N0T7K7_9GAMM|nr:ABC transporter permease [Marinihelvus fidelis]KAA9130761.1 phosphate ABC transporter permease [Marinihelvus fidelis]
MANASRASVAPEFFRQLVVRQIRQDYLDNLSGFAWLILQPLLLLAVYAFVFTKIFQARIPSGTGVDYVPWLAVAFWPWMAFSEAVLKASASIGAYSGLITKVAFDRELLPLATVTSTFAMHMIGYVAILVVLQLLGTDIHWLMLPVALVVLLVFWLLACALALFFSSTQVYIKDMAQVLPPLITLWFFMSPILYSPTQLPGALAHVLAWNPVTWVMGQLRGALLFGEWPSALALLAAAVIVIVLAWAGLGWFRRLAGHFEDFL